MGESVTPEFDNHGIWESLEILESWVDEANGIIDPEYEGLPALADSLLRRVHIVAEVTRIYLDASVKEAVSSSTLDEIRKHVEGISLDLQGIDGDAIDDVDEKIDSANTKVEGLLEALSQLPSEPGTLVQAVRKVDYQQQKRISAYLEKAQAMVSALERKQETLDEQIAQAKTLSKEELAGLRESIEEVAERFEGDIEQGVEAGKKRIDDQIVNLRDSYTKLIDAEKERAETEIRSILQNMTSEKKELDEMVADTRRVAGYIAENEMSRKFEQQASASFKIWIGFIVAAIVVAIITFFTLSSAAESALVEDVSGRSIVEAVIKALAGAGTGAIAGYLFRQASLQQRSYQDSRNAAMRLGSLDAFLERFDDDDAQAIREGVGRRVYIDGELGEIDHRKRSEETGKAQRIREEKMASQSPLDSAEELRDTENK